MSAQYRYRFNLFHVLGLLTVAVGAIVIVMACLAIVSWMFGFGGFKFLNQSGAPLGITPDAALCFILCWVSLWVLRESTGEASPDALTYNKRSKKSDRESKVERGKLKEKKSVHNMAASGFSRRLAQLFASAAALISVSVLAGYLIGYFFGLDALAAPAKGWASQLSAVLNNWGDLGGQGSISTRMAPGAAFAFLLNGIALTIIDVETRGGIRPSQH